MGYSNPDNAELSMVFSFHHLKVDYADGQKWTLMPFDLAALKRIIDQWAAGMQAGGGWNALFWNNHDQPRALNRFGDPGRRRYESATMLATAIHLLRGTPYIYMGEEIGMTDPLYTPLAISLERLGKTMQAKAFLPTTRIRSEDTRLTPVTMLSRMPSSA